MSKIVKCPFCGEEYDFENKKGFNIYLSDGPVLIKHIGIREYNQKLNACDKCAHTFWLGYAWGKGILSCELDSIVTLNEDNENLEDKMKMDGVEGDDVINIATLHNNVIENGRLIKKETTPWAFVGKWNKKRQKMYDEIDGEGKELIVRKNIK